MTRESDDVADYDAYCDGMLEDPDADEYQQDDGECPFCDFGCVACDPRLQPEPDNDTETEQPEEP